jgi:HEAT repeat protein
MTEVHFCNLCDQSVPQDQIDQGSAVRHGGRIVCATCRDVISMAATGQKARGSRAGLIVPLVVGLIGWGAAAFVWAELQDVRGEIVVEASAQATRATQDLSRVDDALSARVASADARAGSLEEGLRQTRDEAARQAETTQAQLLALERAVEPLPDLADAQRRQDGELRDAAAARALLAQDLRDARGALDALRATVAGLEETVSTAAAQPAPAGFPRDVEDLLAQLRNPDALERNKALEKLVRMKDARLIPYVEPMLKDSYEMNRYYAAENLGELKAASAVPALVEALLDEYSLVRMAANAALLAITGQNLNFDPKGNEAERRKGYERWKQWLAGQPQPATGQAG